MNHLRETKTPAPRVAQAPDFYTLNLGKESFAPRYWSSWLILLLLRSCAFLPLGVCRLLGTGLGLLMYASNAKRRHIARVNLAMCFPEMNESERQKLLRRHFKIMGQSYMDLGFIAWAPKRRILSKTRFTGLENYQALIEQGKNIIILVPHCVGINFGGVIGAIMHPAFSMKKLQRNPMVNWLLNKGRMRFGVQLLQRSQGLRPIIRGLKQGMAFYYLPDEDFGPKQSEFVPFFGVPTATLTTLGRLAKLTDAVVIPCFTRLLPGGQGYEVIFKPALTDFPVGDRVADAACMNRELEQGIREMPEQYMWTLKIFKTRPGNAPSPYA